MFEYYEKIKHCYFCKSKCICPSSSTGRQRAKDIMEEDIKFRNTLYKFHENMLRIQDKPKVSHTEDNVVHLDFGNKEQET